jgi:3-oxoadipate enol-lactonase
VTALVLAAPGISGYPFDSPELRKYAQSMREAAAREDRAQYVEYFQRSWTDGPRRSPGDVDPAIRDKVRKMALNSLNQRHPESRAYELEPPALGRLGEIKAPTLAVVGDLDMPDILDIVDRIVAAVPGARKAVISGAAHMVNMEKPLEFNSAVRSFLASVAPR